MNFSHSVTIILAIATIGLSLPARADQAVVNDSTQTAIVNGSNNTVNQNNNTSIQNRGTRGGDNTGTSVRNRQTADVLGDNNTVNQSNQTDVRNQRRTNR